MKQLLNLTEELKLMRQQLNYLNSFKTCPLSNRTAKQLAAKAAEQLSVDILLMEAEIDDIAPVMAVDTE